jgi:hypothetical protein
MAMGQISAAYAVVKVWKIPHGKPQIMFPTKSMGKEVAKTRMKTGH